MKIIKYLIFWPVCIVVTIIYMPFAMVSDVLEMIIDYLDDKFDLID